MDPIPYPWLLYLSSWGVWLAVAALKSLLILLFLEGILAVLAKSLSASARHTFRLLGLLALLLLSPVSLGLPKWNLPLMERPVLLGEQVPEEGRQAQVRLELKESAGFRETIGAEGQASGLAAHGLLGSGSSNPEGTQTLLVQGPAGATDLNMRSRPSLVEMGTGLLSVIWILGTLALLTRLLVGIACVWLVRFRSQEVSDPTLKWVATAAATRLNVGRRVKLYTTPRLEVALSVGILRPAVLLPAVVRTWSEARLHSILLHELSHAKRLDNLSNLISEIACIVFWVNPLVWNTARYLRIDRERACDDQVLQAGTRASDYAGHLLEVARAVSSRRLWGSLEVSQSSVLKDRFQALLNPAIERRRLSESGVLKALLLVLFVLLPVSTVEPWSEPVSPLPLWPSPLALQDTVQSAPKLRRSGAPRHSLNPVVNPSGSLFSKQSRRSVLRADGGTDSGRRNETMADTSSVTNRPSGRPVSTVISTANAVGRSESARGLERFSELFSARRTPGSSESGDPQLRPSMTGMIGSIPTQSLALEAADREVFDLESGRLPASEREIEVVEVATYDLGTLGVESEAADINDEGVVVGQSRTVEGVVHPFLWSKEVGMMDLGEAQQVHTRAVQINTSNKVLCETFDSYVFRAYVWSPEGGLKDVGALDSFSPLTVPQAMNEPGHVVGSSRGSGGTLKAFVWTPETGILEIDAPGWSEALDINDSDQVVGYSDNRAFIWSQQGGFRYIGPEDVLFSAATSVNRFGQVVGWARYQEDQPRAFFWSPEEGLIDLGGLNPSFPLSMAYEISDRGVVVGHSLSMAGNGQEQEVRAFRWTPESGMEGLGRAPSNSRIALNALGQIVGTNLQASDVGNPLAYLWTEEGRVTLTATPDPTGLSSEGVAINNHGQIAGNTLLSEDLTRAYLWEVRFVSRREN